MPKTIVMLMDGTGQQFQSNETNIVRLLRLLPPDQPERQIAFYGPGVGTRGAPTLTPFGGEWRALAGGLALGAGIYERVADAYRYLAQHWVHGDRIHFYGFSRGAFSVRALAGLVAQVGLMGAGFDNLIPYAIRLYASFPIGGDKAAQDAHALLVRRFGETFGCRFPDIAFIGLFDTVKSVFSFDRLAGQDIRVSLAGTYANPRVKVVRHAMAIDERRAFFRTNKWRALNPALGGGTDVRQVWFAGCHGDVGGGVPETESGLSAITLEWMLKEAVAHGLLIDPGHSSAAFGQPTPDVLQPAHDSLTGFWKALEWLPTNPRRGPDSGDRAGWRFPRGRPRQITQPALVHQSVVDKLTLDRSYRPPNLPISGYGVEPW